MKVKCCKVCDGLIKPKEPFTASEEKQRRKLERQMEITGAYWCIENCKTPQEIEEELP